MFSFAGISILVLPLLLLWAMAPVGRDLSEPDAASAARPAGLADYYAVEDQALRRGNDATAARYTALAAHVAARDEDVLRGIEAGAARYTGWATYSEPKGEALRRGIDATAARYAAMAARFKTSTERGVDAATARSIALADDYRETSAVIRAREAEIRRLRGLAGPGAGSWTAVDEIVRLRGLLEAALVSSGGSDCACPPYYPGPEGLRLQDSPA
jgi:hypothetical protein